MDTDFNLTLLKILAVIALVLLNGFFVLAEFALVKVRNTQLAPLIAKGNRRALIARKLVSHLDATIGATQLGITLVSLGLGVLVEPVFDRLLSPLYHGVGITGEGLRHGLTIGVGFFVNTYLLVVLGELGPKALAIRKTLPVALFAAPPLAAFYRIAYPFIWLLNWSAQWLLRQVGIEPVSERDTSHSEEEIRLLLSISQRRAGSAALGHEIVLNALDLNRRVARQVMRPRAEIVALDTTASIAECLDIADKTRFSRFPLCVEGDLDQALGSVHIKDLYASRLRAKSGADLAPAAKKIVYVPETARLEKLLQTLLDRKRHLALVVDEYGGTVGLVTLENILEELVGQIQDEFDQEKPRLVKTGDRSWDILGALPVDELAELIGEPRPIGDVSTASGWVTHRLGGFPKVGDAIAVAAGELRVEELDGPRVARLTFRRTAESKTVAGVEN